MDILARMRRLAFVAIPSQENVPDSGIGYPFDRSASDPKVGLTRH
jgi:hypothetical protein